MKLKPEIADDVEALVEVVRSACDVFGSKERPLQHLREAADRVEAWMATYQEEVV